MTDRTTMTGVGSTDHRSTRIWLRCPTDADGFALTLETQNGQTLRGRFDQRGDAQTDWAMSVVYPDDFDDAPALEAATRYRFRIETADGEPVGEGTLRTAPAPDGEPAEPLTFAFMSCHQPFGDDGEVMDKAARMQEVLGPTLEELDVDYVLFIGDQMYADYPEGRSLYDEDYFQTIARHGEKNIFDCDEREMLHHFHVRYRKIFGQGNFADIQRKRATYWMLDDHEIVDNWGAAAAHAQPGWQRLARAARSAFLNYQGAHARPAEGDPPDSFHHEFAWGPAATFITDMRSARALGTDSETIFSEAQFAALEAFLKNNSDKAVLFFVLTVPITPLPKGLVQALAVVTDEGSDVDDRWESQLNVSCRDRFLQMLQTHQESHPDQRIVLLSGDVHLGCALQVRWTDGDAPPFIQLISSGVTNVLGLSDAALIKGVSKLLPMMELDTPGIEAELIPAQAGDNPFTGLNFGIVDVRMDDDSPSLRYRIFTSGDEQAEVGYDSGWI